ncbi:MAG: aminotransferase class I/II-fold pyridoxal phosphate-dependent enzyme [Planctomycetota bacterium]
MTEPLRAESLSLTMRGRATPIVDEVSFALRPQEFFVLVGPNGAGKSSLLDLLGGIRRPTRGSVQVGGDDVHRLRAIDRARRIARIPQSLDSWPAVQVRQFVEHGRYSHERSPRDSKAVSSALQRADLTEFAERDLRSLSGGERQRALVARALAQDAPILLADEPTAALDPRGQLTVLELLARTVCEGHTVLAVTHDLGLASQFADRIGLLSDGRLVAIDEPANLLRGDALDALYGEKTLFRSAFPPDGLGVRRPLVATWRRVEPIHDIEAAVATSEGPAGLDADALGSERSLCSPPDATVRLEDGREVDYFGGTSYLGLHADQGARRAASQALERGGLHAATSRHGSGALRMIDEVEAALGRFAGTVSARTFSSGWITTTAVTCCFDPKRPVFVDEHVHPAQLDAWRSAAVIRRFAHRDAGSLARLLAKHAPYSVPPIVATDSVFAITGDVAPIDAYLEICNRYPHAALVLDDSHGLGVLGENGRGAIEAFSLLDVDQIEVFVFGSLSKALGGQGGVVFGTRDQVERIDSSAPHLLGSTPLGPPAAAALLHNLELLGRDPTRLERLRQNLIDLDQGLREGGLLSTAPQESRTPSSAIRALKISDRNRGKELSSWLLDEGLLVPFFASYPSQPDGRLRIACCANHEPEAIQRLVAALAKRRDEFDLRSE